MSENHQIPTAVYELHFELVDYCGESLEFNEDERNVLAKYAKMQNGFTRDVLVPSTMSLASMHYMIQRLYGWQNGHLHDFQLDGSLFKEITNQNLVDEWLELCGVLFRFPNEDMEDQYCNDNYNGLINFKSWLKQKYSGKEMALCVSDTYVENKRHVNEFKEVRKVRSFLQTNNIDQLMRSVDLGGQCNSLREFLCVKDIFLEPTIKWQYFEWKKAMKEANTCFKADSTTLLQYLTELKTLRAKVEELWENLDITPQHQQSDWEEFVECQQKLTWLEKECRNMISYYEPTVIPFAQNILYSYDYGDGWCVRITCTKIYEPKISESSNTENRILSVATTRKPVCISADGICLLDNVGGIHGFIDMLQTLHGKDVEEATDVREWAKEQGWTGRAVKPSSLI